MKKYSWVLVLLIISLVEISQASQSTKKEIKGNQEEYGLKEGSYHSTVKVVIGDDGDPEIYFSSYDYESKTYGEVYKYVLTKSDLRGLVNELNETLKLCRINYEILTMYEHINGLDRLRISYSRDIFKNKYTHLVIVSICPVSPRISSVFNVLVSLNTEDEIKRLIFILEHPVSFSDTTYAI